MKKSVWHNRLPERVADPVFESLNASIGIDQRLYVEEIQATRAHARALVLAGIYTAEEGEAVDQALEAIEGEITQGQIDLGAFEDIHAVVERRLTELTGDAGAKIQTARSRNEQTVTAQRLFLKKNLCLIDESLAALQAAALDLAERTVEVILPGYTHCRPAQPLRFSHYLCALFFGLERDRQRLASAKGRLDSSSAGAGALAGVPFQLDRLALASSLGFSTVSENALDTVSDRDGNLEVLAHLSILMVRLSRLAEDFILWSAPAYGFLKLDDTYCTSSSLMPQKKNPDGLELVRGKAGRVIGNLTGLLVTLKGLPSGYQKDLQEDKEPLFDAVDTVRACIKICTGVLIGLSVDPVKTTEAVTLDCMATDMADRLVEDGVPFRAAYETVAQCFTDPGAQPGDRRSPSLTVPTPVESVERRDVPGGTSREAVLDQIRIARHHLEA